MLMKILLVEDNEPMRRTVKSFIGDLVDEFLECSNGCEAFDMYTQHRPDLVLMDIQMNDEGGLTATRKIKESFPEARVVIVSQWDGLGVREMARAAGAESHVSKTDLLPLRVLLGAGRQKW